MQKSVAEKNPKNKKKTIANIDIVIIVNIDIVFCKDSLTMDIVNICGKHLLQSKEICLFLIDRKVIYEAFIQGLLSTAIFPKD